MTCPPQPTPPPRRREGIVSCIKGMSLRGKQAEQVSK